MDPIRRDVNDALVWLDLAGCQALLHSLLKRPEGEHQAEVNRRLPDLAGVADLSDPRWREALIDALELRVSGDDDDPDDVATHEVPNLARFAADKRGS